MVRLTHGRHGRPVGPGVNEKGPRKQGVGPKFEILNKKFRQIRRDGRGLFNRSLVWESCDASALL